MKNRKSWYYLTSLKPFVSKKLNFIFLLWYKNEKPASFSKAAGWKPTFKIFVPDDEKLAVFACLPIFVQTYKLDGWCAKTFGDRLVDKTKVWRADVCRVWWTMWSGHCMYFNEHFADFRWTVHTDLSIAYSAEYWRSLRKLVRFPCKRLIDPLWELIDGCDIVDWFSILQGIS